MDPKVAVLSAIRNLVANRQRAYSHSVPREAEYILMHQSSGALTVARAQDQVRLAIDELVKNGQIEAPVEPYKDWRILIQTQAGQDTADESSHIAEKTANARLSDAVILKPTFMGVGVDLNKVWAWMCQRWCGGKKP